MAAVRLPVVGAPSIEARAEAIPTLDDSLRRPFAIPTIALVATSARALASARGVLEHAAVALGKRVVSLTLDAPLLELPAKLLERERALHGAELLITTGAAIVAIRRPRVSILVTDRRAPSEWGADVRSVRDRIDLLVPELDPILARELLARLC